jgi:hypothetical protein
MSEREPLSHRRPILAGLLIIVVSSQNLLLGAAAPSSGSPPTQDIGWPRQVSQNGAQLIYYQPQVDEWKDYKELFARVAFSLTPKGGKEVLGVASMQAGTIVDKDTRTVFFRDVEVSSVRFPSLDQASVPAMEQLFNQLIPKEGEPISVNRVMADLQQGKVESQAVPLKNDPPQIFYSAKPAILLMVQGDPVLAPIQKTGLEFVVNTNRDLFFDKSKKTYYLLANTEWLTAQDIKGPWTQTHQLPKDMSKLPAGENFDDVKKMVPPPPLRRSPAGLLQQYSRRTHSLQRRACLLENPPDAIALCNKYG